MPDLGKIRLTEDGRDFLRFVLGHPAEVPSDDVLMKRINAGVERFGQDALDNASAVLSQLAEHPAAKDQWAARTKVRV